MKATIYHNPRCSKSRGALQILQEKGIEIEEIRYLETPPTIETLTNLCDMLKISPLEMIRSKEALFKELALSVKDERSDQAWLEILVQHPRLIERPIVVINSHAVIARPPELVEELF